MVESGQTHPAPSEQEGPSHDPPTLPDGWLAQWEGTSRKYYYVQRATGHSQWEIPTEPAPSAPTPDPTPQQAIDPFQKPSDLQAHGDKGNDKAIMNSDRGTDNKQGADRGFLENMATGLLSGKPHRPQHQSQPQSGLAGIAGNLVGGFISGGKPHGQQHQQQQGQQPSMFGGSSTPGNAQHGGLMGLASGLLGHHGSSGQQSGYGYTSSNPGSGTGTQSVHTPTSNQTMPATHGVSSSSNQYGPTSGQYNPLGQQQGQYGSDNNQPGLGQSTYNPSVSGHYGQPSQPFSSAPQNQYGQSSQALQTPPQRVSYGQSIQSFPSLPQHGQYGQHPHVLPHQPQSQYGDQNQGFPSSIQGQYGQQNQTFSPSSQSHYGQPGQQNYSYPPAPQGHYGHPGQQNQMSPITQQSPQFGQQPQPYSQPGQTPGQFQAAPSTSPFQQGQMVGQYGNFQPVQPTSGVIPIQQQQSAFPPQYVGPHGRPSAFRPQYGEHGHGQAVLPQPGQPGASRPGQQGALGYGQFSQPQQQPGKYSAAGPPPAPGWRA